MAPPPPATNNLSLGAFIVIVILISQALARPSADSEPSDGRHGGFASLKHLAGAKKGQYLEGLSALKHYLRAFGYLQDSVSAAAAKTEDYFDDHLASAVEAYQSFYRLNISGELDPSTVAIMMAPRCGVPDIPLYGSAPPPHGDGRDLNHWAALYSFVPSRLGKPWPQGKRLNIKYRLDSTKVSENLTKSLPSAISTSIRTWNNAAGSIFKFHEVKRDKAADVDIGFKARIHTDRHPNDGSFDGPGGVLAHARPSENSLLHFDAEEHWTTDGRERVQGSLRFDLQTVALHELGHVLGLGHSEKPSSVMFAFYQGVRRELQRDDIMGIRALYKLK